MSNMFIEQQISKGWKYLTKQELDKAEHLCNKLILIYENQEVQEKINIKKYIVRVEMAKNNWIEANKHIDDILNIKMNIAEIHKLNAMIKYHLNNYIESEKEFRKALEISTKKQDEDEIKEIFSEVLVCLHEYILDKKEIDVKMREKILSILEEINSKKIYSLKILEYLGKIYFNLKEYIIANKQFEKMLKLIEQRNEDEKEKVIREIFDYILMNLYKKTFFNSTKKQLLGLEKLILYFFNNKYIKDKISIEKILFYLYCHTEVIFRCKKDFMNYLVEEIEISKDVKRKKICNIMLNILEMKNKEIYLKSKPINLSICLTNKCNARCKYCNIHNEPWEISDRTKEEIIKLLPFLDNVSWSGGEVFLYKYFFELFSFAKKYDVRQQIVTNGMLLDEEWIKQIITSNTKLAISIRSTEKEKYEYLTKGARYNKLITNLQDIKKYLYKRNPSFELSMYVLVTKYNYMELEKLIDFAKEYNFDSVRFIQLDNSANPINGENICSKDSKFYKPLKTELNKALGKAQKYGIGINCELPIDYDQNKIINYGNRKVDYYYLLEEYKNINDNQLFCIFPWTSLIIINEGFFVFNHFCKINKEYNYSLTDDTILGYWNSKEVLNFREKIKSNNYNNICSSVCTKYNIHTIH